MNIQIFGSKKSNESKKAERYFKERGIKYQFIDMKEKGMSRGEIVSVIKAIGGISALVNKDYKDKTLVSLMEYISDDAKIEKLMENPQLINVPVVRNGKEAVIGYKPDIWKGWE